MNLMGNEQKPMQKTPKEKFEIPIPKRGDVFKVFENAAKPVKSGAIG
jgi:hypothetical protein